MNIQEEVTKIHSKYGTTEKANYEIQLLFEKFHNEKLNEIYLSVNKKLDDAIYEFNKWDGSDTTYGDTDRNAGDVNYGITQAYRNVSQDIGKLLKK